MPLSRRALGYELLAPIATGGMATVYLARKAAAGGFQREVAIKVTHAHLREQEGFVRGLLEEARLTARIRHPNVAQVIDVIDDPEGVCIVMEYVEGDTLSALIRAADADVPLPIAARILFDVLSGLHAAHEVRTETGEPADLVHRDVSPQNILVGTDGVARLIDFGIAKSADRAGLTKSGVIKGKFGYMAPEQLRGAPLDRRADVWGVGVVAWELLTRRRLNTGEEAMVVLRTLSEEAPPLRSIRPDVPAPLEAAIASALRIDVAERCPSAAVLRDAIARAVPRVANASDVAAYAAPFLAAALAARQKRALERPPAVRTRLVGSFAPEPLRVRSGIAKSIAIGATAGLGVLAIGAAIASKHRGAIERPSDMTGGTGGAAPGPSIAAPVAAPTRPLEANAAAETETAPPPSQPALAEPAPKPAETHAEKHSRAPAAHRGGAPRTTKAPSTSPKPKLQENPYSE